MKGLWWLALAGCHGATGRPTFVLREACDVATYWNGVACTSRGDGAARVAAGERALDISDVDTAVAALDAAEVAGPLDHEHHIKLWEQRALAAAYVDNEAGAAAAFDMMLAIDPTHTISYKLTTKATEVFEDVRQRRKNLGAPAIDVNWRRGQKVGVAIPIDVEVLADPKQFLRRATVFVRARGDTRWKAADLALPKPEREATLILPPVVAAKPSSLELYLRAYDAEGNEVLAWASPARPREIPLRYDPPPPVYRRPWVLLTAGSVIAIATGVIVYAVVLAPPDKVGGDVSVR